jgi:hypothetical protein
MTNLMNTAKQMRDKTITPQEAATQIKPQIEAFAQEQAAGLNMKPEQVKAMVGKMLQDGTFDPADDAELQTLLNKSAGWEDIVNKYTQEGSANPVGDAMQHFSALPTWAKAGIAIGLPMAAVGLLSTLFGEGGSGSMIMSILGLVGGAGGLGLFGGQGMENSPLFGAMPSLHGIGDNLSTIFGGGQGGTSSPAPAGPPPQPFDASMPPAARMMDVMHDQQITPEEGKQILATPEVRKYLTGRPLAERQRVVQMMLDGNPAFKDEMVRARAAYNNNLPLPFGLNPREQAYAGAAAQGIERPEFDKLMESLPATL